MEPAVLPAALIVDDDPSVCAVFGRLLGKMGYLVKTVCDGAEALSLATQTVFDVCLVDKQLPGVGGIAVARGLRSNTPDAVIIFITGHATAASAEELVGIADEYLTKPFDLDTLRETVLSLTAQRQARRLSQPSPVPARGPAEKWVHLSCSDPLSAGVLAAACEPLGAHLTRGDALPPTPPNVLVLSADLASFEVRKVIWAFQAARRSFQVVLLTHPSSTADAAAAVALRASWRINLPATPEQAAVVLGAALR